MSEPAQKAFPSPVKTTQPTSGSIVADANTSFNSAINAADNAFNLEGLDSITRRTPERGEETLRWVQRLCFAELSSFEFDAEREEVENKSWRNAEHGPTRIERIERKRAIIIPLSFWLVVGFHFCWRSWKNSVWSTKIGEFSEEIWMLLTQAQRSRSFLRACRCSMFKLTSVGR